MARAHVSPARATVAPSTGGVGRWIVGGLIAIVLAVVAYFVVVGGTYNAPYAPPTGAPATGAPAPQVTAPGAPAPQVTSAPAPRYP